MLCRRPSCTIFCLAFLICFILFANVPEPYSAPLLSLIRRPCTVHIYPCVCYLNLFFSHPHLPSFSDFFMDASRVPAVARSAVVLGSRNARRQLKFVLAAASEAGAYKRRLQCNGSAWCVGGLLSLLRGRLCRRSQGIRRGCIYLRRAARVERACAA